LSNTVPVDAYRGAGKRANYIIERCIEAAARRLGDPPGCAGRT
jgi:CO/xanthine dehydrogenase Mo-binding subunit